ncbi:MAG: hypothetical protein K1060chlam4_00382 [Candidatus Anoxychlamydiales bacterium]|nr:hypothetical protein [Candidatus Anoxychlamydiales bacterium]
MKLELPRRDFFIRQDPDYEFCEYLRSKGKFILKEVVKEIKKLDPESKIDYNILYDRISVWEGQRFIKSNNIATLGGPKYEYYFSEAALKILDRYKPSETHKI